MANYLSKVHLNDNDYLLKDSEAQASIADIQEAIEDIQEGKQDAITESNKLAASLVSASPATGSSLSYTEVQTALEQLEAAISSGGTGSVVNVEKKATAEGDNFASYIVTQGGTQVGDTINIPKDFLVKSAELKTAGASDPSGFPEGTKYIDFVVNSKDGTATDEHIRLNVADLVDAYRGDGSTIILGANNTFSVGEIGMDQVDGLEAEFATVAGKFNAVEASVSALDNRVGVVEESMDDLGELAYKNSATGTVPGQNITGVKATGDLSGTAEISIATETASASLNTASYTPAGTVSAADTDGTFNALKTAAFQADNNGVQIGGTNAASEVTIEKQNATVLGSVSTAAVAPSFTDDKIGTFVAPQLTIAESDAFAKAGFTATMGTGADAETLFLTAAETGKASVCSGWNAGSWTQGTFNPGSAAQFENATVVGSITSAEAAAQVFTGNKYSVATTADTALKNVKFVGTELANALVTEVSYQKVKDAQEAATVTIEGAELEVGTIAVAAKEVTVE